MFDVTLRESFDIVENFYTDFLQCSNSYASAVLLGNKVDLERREVSVEEAEERARTLGLKYFDCSALTGEGIPEAFEYLGNILTHTGRRYRDSILMRDPNKDSCNSCKC